MRSGPLKWTDHKAHFSVSKVTPQIRSEVLFRSGATTAVPGRRSSSGSSIPSSDLYLSFSQNLWAKASSGQSEPRKYLPQQALVVLAWPVWFWHLWESCLVMCLRYITHWTEAEGLALTPEMTMWGPWQEASWTLGLTLPLAFGGSSFNLQRHQFLCG